MVYGKYMSRGFASEFIVVVAPNERALETFISDVSNDNPGSRTVRVLASSYEIREWKRLQVKMRAFSPLAVDGTIYLREDGSRDFQRGAPVREREHWANHA